MNTQVGQSTRLVVPPRLRQRFESLGVTVATLDADGRAIAHEPCRPTEQLVLDSSQLAAELKGRWSELLHNPGQAMSIWPGLWLVPLPEGRRRRVSHLSRTQSLLAAVLIGPELLDSEQFQLVCDTRRLDRAAVAGQVESGGLVTPREAQRLAATIGWMRQDTVEMDRALDELQGLSSQLANTYEELSLVYKFSTSMTVNQAPDEFLEQACSDLQQTSGLGWLALQLTDGEPRLNDLAGEVFVAGQPETDSSVLKDIGRSIMLEMVLGSTPAIVEDTTALGIDHLSKLTQQLLIVWLMREGRPLGILFGGDKTDGTSISSVDSKLCNSLANSITIFLENMMLFEDMQAMFIGTLHALTKAVDAKDSYTHGHSERVALMSRLLANAAGLDPHTVDRVYIAGLLHDVGKIGVPESVLTKTGPLTDEEFDLIKMHPEVGAKILQNIRQMQDLIPGVLYHHERWDGRGYPENLAGNQIPLFGRIIGLADAFDAMSSTRTYRQSIGHTCVINEIKSCAGTQFDSQLAQIFVQLDFQLFNEMIHQHQMDASPVRTPS